MELFDKSDVKIIEDIFKKSKEGYEFEFMFNNYKQTNKLSITNYINIIKYYKYRSLKDKKEIETVSSFDITYTFDKSTVYRISINGINKINILFNMFAKKDNYIIVLLVLTKFINDPDVTMMKKTRFVDLKNDFDKIDIRLRSSNEEQLNNSDIEKLKSLTYKDNRSIFFRFKDRARYEIDKDINVDMTATKQSGKIYELTESNYVYELEIDMLIKKSSKINDLNKIYTEIENIIKIFQHYHQMI